MYPPIRYCKDKDLIDQYCYCKERFLSVTQPNLDGCKDAILKVNIIYDVNTFGDKPFNYCFTKLCREYFCYTVLLGTFGW
jgi:hypothetical protein